MVLRLDRLIPLPQHSAGGFNHGDVYEANSYVYIAHPATASVETVDGMKGNLVKTIAGCPDASGVVCAQGDGLVFAASRGTGKVLVINAVKATLNRMIQAGSKPNGLSWDDDHGVLLVADVGDMNARLVDPHRGAVLRTVKLPGRPRWGKYSRSIDKFVILIRDPPGYVTLSPKTGELGKLNKLSINGPHGIDLSSDDREAYISCDGGSILCVDLERGTEICSVKIPGIPDVAWFNPTRKRLYCALPKPGLIVVLDTVELKIVQELKTEEGCGTIAFDRSRQRLYAFLPKTCKAAAYIES